MLDDGRTRDGKSHVKCFSQLTKMGFTTVNNLQNQMQNLPLAKKNTNMPLRKSYNRSHIKNLSKAYPRKAQILQESRQGATSVLLDHMTG
jgi:hypothetical protein